MPFCLCQVLAPGVESVLSKQKAVGLRVLPECLAHLIGKSAHVLRVFNDRQQLLMLVRLYARQSFQHLVTLHYHNAVGRVKIRKQRTPNGMSMKNYSRTAFLYDPNVQKTFV